MLKKWSGRTQSPQQTGRKQKLLKLETWHLLHVLPFWNSSERNNSTNCYDCSKPYWWHAWWCSYGSQAGQYFIKYFFFFESDCPCGWVEVTSEPASCWHVRFRASSVIVLTTLASRSECQHLEFFSNRDVGVSISNWWRRRLLQWYKFRFSM